MNLAERLTRCLRGMSGVCIDLPGLLPGQRPYSLVDIIVEFGWLAVLVCGLGGAVFLLVCVLRLLI